MPLPRNEKLSSPVHGRTLALMHIAMFEALNAIDRRYQPYRLNLVTDRNTSREAAAAAAGHEVLVAQYPEQKAALDALLAQQLSAVPEGPATRTRPHPRPQGRRGNPRRCAMTTAARRRIAYRPVTQPGQYVPTAPVVSAGVGHVDAVGDGERCAIPPGGRRLR